MSSTDTDETTERVHLDLLKRASPGRRLELALSLSATVIGLSRRSLARANPGLAPDDLAVAFVRTSYGEDLAQELRTYLRHRAL